MTLLDVKKEEFIDEPFDPALIKAPKIRDVYEYWLSKHQGHEMPSPDDIDILDLDFAIGSISLIDVTDQSPRFQIRMVGSQVVERHGQENTHRFVDEIEVEDTREILLSSYGRVFARREPFWIERRTFSEDHIYNYECLILPLAGETGQVVQLMSVLEWPGGASDKPPQDPRQTE